MHTSATYLKTMVCLLGLCLCLNITFNWIVDPFDAFQILKREGFNEVKPRAAKYERVATPLILQHLEAERLYLGTSRTEIALRGDAPALPPMLDGAGGTTFNSGISGASIYEIMLLFQHAIEVTPLREAVLGLEIHAFSFPGPARTEIDNYVARDWRGGANHGYRWHQLRDNLLSLDVSSNSLETLAKQAPQYDTLAADGRHLAAKTLADSLEGRSYSDLFGQWIGEFVSQVWTPCPNGRVLFRYSEQFDSFDRFRDILVLAAQHQVNLKLYLSPSHVLLMDAMWQSGVWPDSEYWKGRLVTIVDEVNQQYGTDFSIIDFEGVDRFSTEPLPKNNRERMQWFFDPVHTTPALGDLMLARMYQQGAETADTWGRSLNPAQLPRHLHRLRRDLREWQQQQPRQWQWVQDIVQSNTVLRPGAPACPRSHP